ncbi:MAG: lysophospholipid acyltransferase family protein [Acidaminococcus sp.]|jgi:KDO2-lipid IV(A) lauroyltransferase|nr:lysophospholipid acyltransferase family protein [Acidaminococcus sp.]MCI2099865.1 lysophospholipid acyltransferase family protein [Acidaminococcus sp.]MCI2114096.1 lysophospholipid acyltransferase family protein [Acidaminococcus sp.]MCI2116036.1 lysophospholipid acyltransferase family protein [Acidaminococcus sp.]
MLYSVLKGMSTFISWLPYKLVVRLGRNCGKIYWRVAKKQRIRAEETIVERMGVTPQEGHDIIYRLFLNLGMTFMEMLYMPALNKDNIRGLVKFDRPDVLWEALAQKKGVVMLACHMDNWEWLGAALALNGFPLSAVEKPQPNPVYSDFMNELRRGVGQEIFARGTNEILGCARAMKKGRMLGLIADQDGGPRGIFVPFFGKMASTPEGPAYFARKFNAPVIPIFIVRRPGGYGHQVFVKDPIYYENTGDQKHDDYVITLKMTQEVEKIIRQYPDNWIWFQHRWNTPYEG